MMIKLVFLFLVQCYSRFPFPFGSTVVALSNYGNHHHRQERSENRRIFLQKLSITYPFLLNPTKASSFEEEENKPRSIPNKTFVKGTIVIKGNDRSTQQQQEQEQDFPKAALYITAKLNKSDDIPRAILDGSNGKPPPVLTKRITTPQFPCEFNLSSLDLTQEGAALLLEDGTSFGFEGKDLIISARFDTDGIASTRDPNDLVGRAMFAGKLRLDDGHQIITLSGRGITGKLVTGKK